MKIFFVLLFLVGGIVTAQTKDPDKILEEVKAKFSEVQDYEVNVKIKIDVDFLKVPVTEAKIYYKQPDKIQVESESFALIPKEGLNFSPVSLLKDNYTAIFEKEDVVEGYKVSVVKVIPLKEKSDIVLTTMWIDQTKSIVRKIETSTKFSGTFLIDLKYDESKTDYPLPSSLTFTFNVDDMNLPKGMTGEMKSEKKTRARDRQASGKVYITYSNYIVNKGISDSVFDGVKK